MRLCSLVLCDRLVAKIFRHETHPGHSAAWYYYYCCCYYYHFNALGSKGSRGLKTKLKKTLKKLLGWPNVRCVAFGETAVKQNSVKPLQADGLPLETPFRSSLDSRLDTAALLRPRSPRKRMAVSFIIIIIIIIIICCHGDAATCSDNFANLLLRRLYSASRVAKVRERPRPTSDNLQK